MRNLSEVKNFLEERGFEFYFGSYGQSYRHRAVLFYWKKGELSFPEKMYGPEYIKYEDSPIFIPQFRGRASNGKQIVDLVRLIPVSDDSPEKWAFEEYYSTRKFQEIKVWEGRSFKDWYGIKIVKLPEDKSDLEPLVDDSPKKIIFKSKDEIIASSKLDGINPLTYEKNYYPNLDYKRLYGIAEINDDEIKIIKIDDFVINPKQDGSFRIIYKRNGEIFIDNKNLISKIIIEKL